MSDKDFDWIRKPRLKPCPHCGHPVEMKWIAGISKNLRQHVFADRLPAWYILCDCGMNMACRIAKATFEAQQKGAEKLGRTWNNLWKAENWIETRVIVFVREDKEVNGQDRTQDDEMPEVQE